MKTQLSRIACIALMIGATAAGNQATQAQDTNFFNTFIYQGRLADDYGPGWDDSPRTWDFLVNVIRPPIPCFGTDCGWFTNCNGCLTTVLGTNSVVVNQGLFSMPIVIPEEMLSSVNGLYLQFAVRTNGGGAFTTLWPAQRLTATPYASVAQSISGPIDASSLTGQMPTGMLTGIFSSPLSLSNPGNVFAGDGSLLVNVNATTIGGANPCDLTCYWKLIGNGGTDPNVNFFGTTDNTPLVLRAYSQIVTRYYPHPTQPDGANLIGGAFVNTFSGGWGSVICGGGGVGNNNTVLANVVGNDHSAIVGGLANRIYGRECFIGGGWANTNGNIDSHYVVIGGGSNNFANMDFAFIGGGVNNSALDVSAVVGGGEGNTATGLQSTVGGGWHNVVTGWASVIAGGYTNVATGQSSSVGGGYLNIASNLWATIGGGAHNLNLADWGTIGGGYGNLVSGGAGATVPGGEGNSATAAGTFAAGTHATAAHEGAFVFADRQPGNFSTDRINQFAVRAENGVMIQGSATVLDLRGDGAIRVAGAGVGSRGPVFIHRADAGNVSGHITAIDHPLADGDPNAILLVTHNYSADTSASRYEPNPVGVWYDGSRWTIYHENTSVAMPVGRAFNVMIIKP